MAPCGAVGGLWQPGYGGEQVSCGGGCTDTNPRTVLTRWANIFVTVASVAALVVLHCSCSGGKQYLADKRSTEELLEDLRSASDWHVRAAAAKRLSALKPHNAI